MVENHSKKVSFYNIASETSTFPLKSNPNSPNSPKSQNSLIFQIFDLGELGFNSADESCKLRLF